MDGLDALDDDLSITATHRIAHPTVKPLKLMSYLITMGSREGDIVLDPFSGTGTTCIVAMMLKRDYIGIEISPEYHEIALKRLEYFRQILEKPKSSRATR
jgi:DNA modification methylase